MSVCTECGKEDDLRPYGKNGAMVCFECGMKDEAEASRQFAKLFAVASSASNTVAIGEECGVYPIGGNRQ